MPPPEITYGRGAGVYAPPAHLPERPSWGFGESVLGGLGRYMRNVGRGHDPVWRREVLADAASAELPASMREDMYAAAMPRPPSAAQGLWGAGFIPGIGGVADAGGIYPAPPAHDMSIYEMLTGPKSPSVVENWEQGHPWMAGLQTFGAGVPIGAYTAAATRSLRGSGGLGRFMPSTAADAPPDPTRRAVLQGGLAAAATLPFVKMRGVLGGGARVGAGVAAATADKVADFAKRFPDFWRAESVFADNVTAGRLSAPVANAARTHGGFGQNLPQWGRWLRYKPLPSRGQRLDEPGDWTVPTVAEPVPELERVVDEFFRPHGVIASTDEMAETTARQADEYYTGWRGGGPAGTGDTLTRQSELWDDQAELLYEQIPADVMDELDSALLDPWADSGLYAAAPSELDTLSMHRMDDLVRSGEDFAQRFRQSGNPYAMVENPAADAQQGFLPKAIAEATPQRVLDLKADEYLTEGPDALFNSPNRSPGEGRLTPVLGDAALNTPLQGRTIARYYTIDGVPVVTLSYSDEVLQASQLNRATTDVVLFPNRRGMHRMLGEEETTRLAERQSSPEYVDLDYRAEELTFDGSSRAPLYTADYLYPK